MACWATPGLAVLAVATAGVPLKAQLHQNPPYFSTHVVCPKALIGMLFLFLVHELLSRRTVALPLDHAGHPNGLRGSYHNRFEIRGGHKHGAAGHKGWGLTSRIG